MSINVWKVLLFLGYTSYTIWGYEVHNLNTPGVNVAYAPYWDDNTECLYFVNYETNGTQPCLLRYSYRDNTFYSAYIEGVTSPSFIIPTNKKYTKCNKCNNELFAVGVGTDTLLIKWDGKSTEASVFGSLFSVNDAPYRFDTGVADKYGRFYGGTVSESYCKSNTSRSVYRWTKNEGVVLLFGGPKSTTGIVFNEDENKLYHLGTCVLSISEFDYDPKTGDICNGRVVFNFPLDGSSYNDFSPIGLAIDRFGFLYTAIDSGEVWKIDPRTGDIVEKIKLPQPGPGALAFGGPKRDILYVVFSSSTQGAANGTSLCSITGLVGGFKSSRFLSIK